MCRRALKNSPRPDCRTPITYNQLTRVPAQSRAVKPFDRRNSRYWYVIGNAKLRKRGEISNINNNQLKTFGMLNGKHNPSEP